jgi:type VI secretion system protein ImpH
MSSLMRDFGWRSPSSVEAWLQGQPYSFDFFQAVRILETLAKGQYSPGTSSDPERELVRFRSHAGLEFPPSDIHDLGEPKGKDKACSMEMVVNFLCLAGALGPLPQPDTERLIEQTRRKDFAFRDFLDVFHHRLISLFYRVRKAHHVALTHQSPEIGPAATYLYSLFGLGLPSLGDRTAIPDRIYLHYAGLLSQQPRSAAGLERLLSDHFPLPIDNKHRGQHRPVAVQVCQFTGKWHSIEPDQWTRIGRGGQNQRIGMGVVLGTRVWNQAGSFEVRIGPLPMRQFLDFLPTGTAFRPLVEMTRFYAGQEFEFTYRFIVEKGQIPELKLGNARLGWTSWIREEPFVQDDSQVRIDPELA